MKPIVSFFVKYPIWSTAVIILLCFLGFMSLKGIKRSFLPERSTNNIAVQVIYPGASAEEVEEGITLKIENAVRALEKVDEVSSETVENMAIITIGRKSSADVEEMLSDVKNAIDQINTFPAGAERPVVIKLLPKNPAMSIVLYGDEDLIDLRDLATEIKNDILASDIISQIKLSGFPSIELAIEVNSLELERYNITFSEIVRAIQLNNRDLSSGSIKTGEEEIVIRSKQKSISTDHIENIIVRTSPEGGTLKVKDLGTVKYQIAEVPNRLYHNGKTAIAFNIAKLPEEDIIGITDYLREYVVRFNKKNDRIQMDIISDESVPLNQRIEILTENGLMGLVLVVISLGIFLNVRLAFWVAMGIPTSFLGMMIIGYLCGITINQISLFGMILVIGILVDDGIVISENIYSQLQKGKSPLRASVDGLMEVLPSVFVSVFTTIIAFTGLFFIEGYVGDFIGEVAIVVIACLAVSLIEAMFVLPAHLSSKAILGKPNKFTIAVNDGVNYVKNKLYGRSLKFIIKWRTLIVLGVPIITFSLLIGLIKGDKLSFSLFPFIDSNTLNVELVLEQGTEERLTASKLQDIDKIIWSVNEDIKKERKDTTSIVVSTTIGIGTGANKGGHAGEIVIKLLDEQERNYDGSLIAQKIKEKTGEIERATKFTIGGRSDFGKPVVIGLAGTDLKDLREAKKELKIALKNIPSLTDIVDNDIEGKKEVNLELKPQAKYLGLTLLDISSQIREAFYGKEAQSIQKGEDEVKIWVRYPKENRASFADLNSMQIITPMGIKVPLREVASYTIKRGVVNINHNEGAREIKIEASQINPNEPLEPILEKISEEILPQILVNHPSLRVIKGGQEKENIKFARSRDRILFIVVLAIYLVMALAFRSWTQPTIILLMIPFGAASAFIGHFIHDQSVVIMSQFGLIGLCGVIINDAIVFLDKYNDQIKLGQSSKIAIYSAGKSRFRAIMLTSITTVLGLYPLIFETSTQAKFLVPMAISLTYGVLFGTFFILFYFPTLILTLNDIKRIIWSLWYGKWLKAEMTEPAYREKQRLKRQAVENWDDQ